MRASVVIPAYQAEVFIGDAIASCKRQDIENEIIVVDDGSTDDTARVARRAGADRVISLPRNYGAAAALRFGFISAYTEYIAWLSADDFFIPDNKLSRQIAVMDETQADFSYYSEFISGGKVVKPRLDFLVRMGFPYLAVMSGNMNPINGSSLMFRNKSIGVFGSFNPALRSFDPDGELVLRWLRQGAKLARIDGIGIFYRKHPGQTSANKIKMQKAILTTRMKALVGL